MHVCSMQIWRTQRLIRTVKSEIEVLADLYHIDSFYDNDYDEDNNSGSGKITIMNMMVVDVEQFMMIK